MMVLVATADQHRERERLGALHALQILDTPPEERFDRIARLAAMILGTPVGLIGFIDEDRQWFKAAHGTELVDVPLETSICRTAVVADEPLVVPDATRDERFAHFPTVTGDPHVRFYAGWPVHAPSGEALGTICVFDSTPRRPTAEQLGALRDLARVAELELGATRASEALIAQREEHAWLLAVLDASTDGVLALSRDGQVGLVNQTAEQLLRLPEGGAFADDVAALLGTEPAPGVTRCELLRADGTTFPALCRRTPVGGPGAVVGELIAFTDLTEQLALGRMQDDFTRLAAHELRTPLTSVLGFGELLGADRDELTPRHRDAVDAVVRNARRLEVLVDDLLLVMRLESGHVGLRREPVDVRAVVAEVCAAAGISLGGPDAPAVADADSPLVRRAVRAMVDQSLRGTPEGAPPPDVVVRAADGIVEIAVTDHGPGLPADELAQITRPFHRAATSGPFEGPGLDLTIARGVAEAHGGRFGVASPAGAGLVTTLALPAVSPAG
jgi:signal transduction histidine kinase